MRAWRFDPSRTFYQRQNDVILPLIKVQLGSKRQARILGGIFPFWSFWSVSTLQHLYIFLWVILITWNTDCTMHLQLHLYNITHSMVFSQPCAQDFKNLLNTIFPQRKSIHSERHTHCICWHLGTLCALTFQCLGQTSRKHDRIGPQSMVT